MIVKNRDNLISLVDFDKDDLVMDSQDMSNSILIRSINELDRRLRHDHLAMSISKLSLPTQLLTKTTHRHNMSLVIIINKFN
jgi:hypothetical protein